MSENSKYCALWWAIGYGGDLQAMVPLNQMDIGIEALDWPE